MPSLTFLGAAGTVTGSKHLLDTGTHRVLVDCGLFQGLKELRERNWQPLPIAASVHRCRHPDARASRPLRLPAAAGRAGFQGSRVLYARHARPLFAGPARLGAHPGRGRARRESSRLLETSSGAAALHARTTPQRALTLLQPVGYNRPVPVVPGLDVEFINAGHLLGSAYARVTFGGKTILFGGDLGRYGRPVLPDPVPIDRADVLLVESTYGDRLHEPDDRGDRLAAIVNAAVAARRKADHPGVRDRPRRRSRSTG